MSAVRRNRPGLAPGELEKLKAVSKRRREEDRLRHEQHKRVVADVHEAFPDLRDLLTEYPGRGGKYAYDYVDSLAWTKEPMPHIAQFLSSYVMRRDLSPNLQYWIPFVIAFHWGEKNWRKMYDLYKQVDEDLVRDALANCLIDYLSTREQVRALAELVRDPAYGSSRILLILTLRRRLPRAEWNQLAWDMSGDPELIAELSRYKPLSDGL